VKTRIWTSEGERLVFPERETKVLRETADSAVCFSGGGMPALCAATGQLRGLRALGLLARIRYAASVSGGARAAIVFTYYRSGAAGDEQLLGRLTPPEAITFARLDELAPSFLGALATKDPSATIERLAREGVPPDQRWLRAAGIEYLAPFGLYDPSEPALFSYDAARVEAIVRLNPSLAGATFYTVRAAEPRPYLIVLTTFVCPTGASPFEEYRLVNCETTPLSVGNPYELVVTYRPCAGGSFTTIVGGGYVEPFAFGSPALEARESGGIAAVAAPPRPYTLADVLGTTTASYAPADHNRDGAASPKWEYWHPAAHAPAAGISFNFGDGGYLDNYGLMPILLRKVPRIAVFINTDVRLRLDYDPDDPPGPDDIDPTLPPLFGFTNPYSPFNQVFERSRYAEIVRALQRAREAGRTVMTTSELTVLPNTWWGIEGGSRVTILWVYNDRVREWESMIPERTGVPEAIEAGNLPHPSGPFAGFPNYRVSGQNAPGSLALTPPQINLLADLSCWNVTANAGAFRALLAR
jgi:hypothetical protein